MGRPLSDKFWRIPSSPGYYLGFDEAWIPGENGPTPQADIIKQSGTRKYIVKNTSTQNEGVVSLVNTPITGKGQAYKMVFPWTNVGSGATIASFTFRLVFASIVSGGTGYSVGQTLTVVGGTGTSATLTITSVSSLGTITGVTINNIGNYTVIPPNLTANPVTNSGSGSGATLKLVMGVNSAVAGTVGTGYASSGAMAIVSGSGGEGAILFGVPFGGVINSWQVYGAGFGFTGTAVTAQIFGIGAVEYARTILANRVKTWQGNSYVWSKKLVATKFGDAILITT
jgi:hypothetical protein